MRLSTAALLAAACTLAVAQDDSSSSGSSQPDWTLTTTEWASWDSAWNRSAYVSNGYISQRIPSYGMGYVETKPLDSENGTNGWPLFQPRGTQAIVAGFWGANQTTQGTNFPQEGNEQPISTLPTWSSIYVTIDGATYSVDTPEDEIVDWRQSLSLEHGLVQTEISWQPSNSMINGTFDLKYTLLTSRTRPTLGVVRLDISGVPDNTTVYLTDLLDGAGSWRTEPVSAGPVPNGSESTIHTAVQPVGVPNVTAYEVSLFDLKPADASSSPNSTTDFKVSDSPMCYEVASMNASTASQCYEITSRGEPLTAYKWVGIASTDAFPGEELETALNASMKGMSDGWDAVLQEHQDEWQKTWDDADIEIPGEDMMQLQLATRASLFHLLTNVRNASEGSGLGDNSIAPAGLTSDSYAGLIFWDASTWMYPPLLVLQPDVAANINAYRFRLLDQARENAQMFGNAGAQYPWTSGRYGTCTGTGPCHDYEYHLNSDIALAHYQYWSSTQNETWLREEGWPVIESNAAFWASHVVYNETVGKYATLNETDPDEYANHIDNGAFTNAGVFVTLKQAIEVAGVLGYEHPSNWSEIADNMIILKDNSSGITLEFDGFNGTTEVKQADVVLLTFPLDYDYPDERALADLDYYSGVTSAEGPGMTYSVFSIDSAELSVAGCASWTYFLEAAQPYSRPPYYQFSEQTLDDYQTNGGQQPAFTFLTGHGGFLQALTHGFTGHRTNSEAFYLDPVLPPQLKDYTIKGMKWGGASFDVHLETEQTRISLKDAGDSMNSTVRVQIGPRSPDAGNYTLSVGEGMTVRTRAVTQKLVDGNVAQCVTVLNEDHQFDGAAPEIEQGQYALAAVDGSNATLWRPLGDSGTLALDLQEQQSISKVHINWGSAPAQSFSLMAGSSLANMTEIVMDQAVNVSAPYSAEVDLQVANVVGNTTDYEFDEAVVARYFNFTVNGTQGEDETYGATVAELALISSNATSSNTTSTGMSSSMMSTPAMSSSTTSPSMNSSAMSPSMVSSLVNGSSVGEVITSSANAVSSTASSLVQLPTSTSIV